MAQGNAWRAFAGYLARAKGAIAVARGRVDEAESLFTDSIDVFRRYGIPFEEAETLRAWGGAVATEDPKRAIEKYDAALAIYTSRDIGKAWIDRVQAHRKRIE
jgi:tetratricopeptide (TPR) repeat protein